MQTWPELKKMALAAPAEAMAASTSPAMITGDLPPSSSDTRFIESMAVLPISLPDAGRAGEGDLVDAGCWVRAAPAVSPKPVTMLTTPAG